MPLESLKRIKPAGEDGPNHFEKAKYLEKLRELFLNRFNNRDNVVIIDGDGSHSEREVSESLWSLVEPIVHTAEET